MIDAFLQWAELDSMGALVLAGFGLFAQVLFFSRWLVQWFASERRGASHIPVAFWWLSLAGASMLAAYFIMRREVIGLIGQSTGWIIYSRNLWLIYRERVDFRRSVADVPDAAPAPEPDAPAESNQPLAKA